MSTQGTNKDIVFLSGRRTPFGSFGGSLRQFSATDLAVLSARPAFEDAGVEAEAVGHVVYGNALQTSGDAIYLARHVGLRVGIPERVPALTLNRLCGSGFQAIVSAAHEVLTGDADVCLCGGTESMSQAPHVVRGARWGDLRLGESGGFFEDSLWAALRDAQCGLTMAETAEELACRYGVTRAWADEVAYRSHMRAKAASDEGRFDTEVVPVRVRTRKGDQEFRRDEHVRPDTTLDGLAALKPYFKADGLVTAGNASGIGDGAASTVIADGRWAERLGLKPLARLVSWAFVGVEPRIMGIGPAPAVRSALARAGLDLEAMDLVEINEAFSPQYCSVETELGLDPERTNVDGGAIALTHPLAASGARLTIHLIHELRRRGGRYGVAAACIGGGQGGAVVVEAL